MDELLLHLMLEHIVLVINFATHSYRVEKDEGMQGKYFELDSKDELETYVGFLKGFDFVEVAT